MKRLLHKIYFLLVALLLAAVTSSHLHAQLLIGTVAGEPYVTSSDGDGGPARLAHFYYSNIAMLATDKKGNIYVPDETDGFSAKVIRKIDARGMISRFAGTGLPGAAINEGDGGLAINAGFQSINNIVTDPQGNLYVLDYWNSEAAIRRIDAQTGIISTVISSAGTVPFGPGVLARDAKFHYYKPFTVDASGNIYLLHGETSRQIIYKIDHATGMISVYADFTNKRYDDVRDLIDFDVDVTELTVDHNGNLYMTNVGAGQCIYKVSASGVMTRVAGVYGSYYDASGDGGPAIDASLFAPQTIALDTAGNLLIGDSYNGRIRKVDLQTGIITTIAGNGDYSPTGDGGLAIDAGVGFPLSIKVTADGSIITAGDQVIRKIAEKLVSYTFDTIPAKTYGDAAFALGTYAYASNASTPAFRSGNPAAVAVTADGQATIVGAGTATLFADFPAVGTDTAITYTQTITVAKKELTVIANNQAITIDDPVPALTVRYEGFVNGDDSTSLNILPVAATIATDASPEGNYPITVDGGADDNYSFTYVPATLFVAARQLKPQTITFPAITDKTYGDTDFATGAVSDNATIPVTFKSSNTKVATVSSAGTVDIIGVGQVTITASQAADAFYTAAPDAAQTFTINKALLSITADNKTKAYGADMPALTLSYSGWKNGDTVKALTTIPKPATTATKTADAGTYPITISEAAADNYTFEYHEGVLTITPLVQTINFTALPVRTYADGDFAAGATSTNTSVPVTYSSNNPAVATINADGTIHIAGVGVAMITAAQAGNTNYTAASDAAQQLTITAAPLTIMPDTKTMTQGQELPAFTFSYSGFKQGETAAILTTQPVATTTVTKNTNPGVYAITASGAMVNDHYTISYRSGNLRVLVDSSKSGDQLNSWMSSPSQLQVNVFTVNNQKATIEIFSLYGQRIVTQQVYLVYNTNTIQVPVGNIASGLYIVRVTGQYLRLTQKIRIDH